MFGFVEQIIIKFSIHLTENRYENSVKRKEKLGNCDVARYKSDEYDRRLR